MNVDVAVIGAGAAGLFFCAELSAINKNCTIALIERTKQVGTKIRLSGGGRCNVTHACFIPSQLVGFYPRGNKQLRSPFSRFDTASTIKWFNDRGVSLKTEEDGRMFPDTNKSETIVNALINACSSPNVHLFLNTAIDSISIDLDGFILKGDQEFRAKKVVIATGSHPSGHSLAAQLGHDITQLVPSLFSFNIPTSCLLSLSGISVENVSVSIEGFDFVSKGPILMTHHGFSGPAILKLSAWAARFLAQHQYKSKLWIDWCAEHTYEQLEQHCFEFKKKNPKLPFYKCFEHLAKNLTSALLQKYGLDPNLLSCFWDHKSIRKLVQNLKKDGYLIEGKIPYKHEFVTCGGINLQDVDFKSYQSKKIEGLFFAGEVLDIDGVTGGFNFQNAWTGGWHAAHAVNMQLEKV